MQDSLLALRGAARKGKPTHMLVGPTVFKNFGNLLAAGKQVSVTQQDIPSLAGLKYEGGFRALSYEGMPIVEVPGYTAQRYDIIQLEDWHIDTIRPFTPDPIELDGDDYTTKITHGCQLVCENTARQAYGTGISS